MCNFFSAIVTKNLKVLWEKGVTSHEELVKKHKLKDDKLENRDFVRIELTPEGNGAKNAIFTGSTEKADWRYKVDEQGTLPGWYRANAAVLEEKVRKLIPQAIAPFSGIGYVENLNANEVKARDDVLTQSEVDELVASGLLPDKLLPIWTGTQIKYAAGSTEATITEHGKSRTVKIPRESGWHKMDKNKLPLGAPIDSAKSEARYFWRTSGDYDGLLQRRDVLVGDDRRDVGADVRPDYRCGVLVHKSAPKGAAKKKR